MQGFKKKHRTAGPLQNLAQAFNSKENKPYTPIPSLQMPKPSN